MAFLLEPSHHNACGYAHLSREPLDIFSKEPPSFYEPFVWLWRYQCIRRKLISFLLKCLLRRVGIVSFKDNGLAIVEQYMPQLVKQVEPEHVRPFIAEGHHDNGLVSTEPESRAVGIGPRKVRTENKGHTGVGQELV